MRIDIVISKIPICPCIKVPETNIDDIIGKYENAFINADELNTDTFS